MAVPVIQRLMTAGSTPIALATSLWVGGRSKSARIVVVFGLVEMGDGATFMQAILAW